MFSGINRRPGQNLLDKWDIPQWMSVAEQLKAGIRFYDVRIATETTSGTTVDSSWL